MTASESGTILAINTGSSSVKFQLFAYNAELALLAGGMVEDIGDKPSFSVTCEHESEQEHKMLPVDFTFENALHLILEWVTKSSQISIIAHRIVHGGDAFKESVIVTPAVVQKLKSYIPFAPYHQPHNLAGIAIVSKLNPHIPQIACFDTAFHTGRNPLFTEYALPKHIRDKGIRRYGFHGLSYEWIIHSLRQSDPTFAEGRIIAAHLGNGASVCGMYQGKSVDTSMGLTALEGLPMGTRCGTLDAGAVLYMMRELAMAGEEVENLLYNQSGILGLSGTTNNVETLQHSTQAEAQFALDYFSLRVAQFIAEMAVALGGVDAVVFTGGIGEHSAFVRDKVLSRIAFLKPYQVRVIPANEERIMAIHAARCLETHKLGANHG